MNSYICGYLGLWLALIGPSAYSAEISASEFVHREFVVEAALVSYAPGAGLERYETHSGGMADAGSTLGLGFRVDEIVASVTMKPRIEDGRLLVALEMEPQKSNQALGFEAQTLDVTDLKPAAIRLGADEHERVYQLNITPGVRVIDNTPRRLDIRTLYLENWRFPDSPILVNDRTYVGRMTCSQSPVATLDITGVASVEFSLCRMTDSQPWGVLDNGVVTLTNPDDNTTIQISNVANGGPHAVELPGGPYQVWVKWSAPTHTIEEHRQELVALRDRLRKEGELTADRADSFEKQLAAEPGPWVYSLGVRGFRKGERADESE